MAAKAPASRSQREATLRPTLVRTWDIPEYGEVVQDPLTFFEKNEFLALVARAIESAVADGYAIRSLLQVIGTDEATLRRAMSGDVDFTMLPVAGDLVSLITRIFATAPQLLEECYLLWLSIPREKWDDAIVGIRQIDDDTGFGILETFVEQNGSTLRDFLPRWQEQLQTMAGSMRTTPLGEEKLATSPPSTDLKSTAPPTEKDSTS